MRTMAMILSLLVLSSCSMCTYAEGEIEMNWADLKCRMQGGQWRVGEKAIEVYNIEHGEIYRSPQEPSFVCWVVPWKDADGTLKCAFTEATGDPAHWPPTYNFNTPGIDHYIKTLASRDSGQSWTDTGWREPQDPLWQRNSDHHWKRTVVMPDGSLLRTLPHTREDLVKTYYLYLYDESKENQGNSFPFTQRDNLEIYFKRNGVWRSTDGGQTWEEIFYDPHFPFGGANLRLCRDGRLVTLGCRYVDRTPAGLTISESLDGGRSWSEPCLVVPAEGEFKDVVLTSEIDVVELPDGRLLTVTRANKAPHAVQAHLTRTGPGQYEASNVKFGPMPYSGHPFLLQCVDGAIWYAGHGSHFVTLDGGESWQQHSITGSYYPGMVEAEPGCLLNISQSRIGDSPFPYPHDASLRQTRFNYRRADVLEQTDAETPLALSMIDTPPSSDNHVHTWVRADGYSGLAFRIQADGADYYVYMLQMEFPENGDAKAGEKLKAFHLLGRVTDGQLTVLRRRYIGEIALAAVHHGPTYLAVRDNSLEQGGVGVVTVASTGAFKVLELVEDSKLIRDTWWK